MYVEVKYEYIKVDTTKKNGFAFKVQMDGERCTGDLKQFRGHSPNKKSLDSDVQKLITEAKEYAGSRQYEDDLEKTERTTVIQQGDITIESTYKIPEPSGTYY